MIRFALSGKKSFRKGSGARYRKPKDDEVLFLFLTKPTEDEIKKVSADFRLRRAIFSSFASETFSRRLRTKPVQFVMLDYFTDEGEIKKAHVLFVILKNVLIVATTSDAAYYAKLFENISEEMKAAKNNTLPRILHSLLLEDVEENYDVLENVEEEIVLLEREMSNLDSVPKAGISKVIAMKKDLFKMSRQFEASTKIISFLRKGSIIETDEETKLMLAELHDTYLHQISVANSQKEMLSDVIAIYSTNLFNRFTKANNELNVIIKRLAAFALILMVPTVVSGVYGMNFRFLPLASHPQGFWILLFIMAVAGVWLGIWLGKKGWL